MAVEALKLELDVDLSEQVKRAAAARGMAVEAFLREAVSAHLLSDASWAVDPNPLIDARIGDAALASDDAVPWEVFRARFKTFGRRPA